MTLGEWLDLTHDMPMILGIGLALLTSWKLHRRLDALQDRHRAEVDELERNYRRELARLAAEPRPALPPYPPPLEQVGGYRVAPRDPSSRPS